MQHSRVRLKILVCWVALAVGTLSASPATAASILIGAGTLDNPGDLTIIQDGGGNIYEFLDLSSTDGLSVTSALATYSSDGFDWATGVQVSELFSAFGITYANSPGTVTDLNASVASRTSFVSFLGVTAGINGSLGWVDDLTTPTHHTYTCISINQCGPASFANNTASATWPESSLVGVYLVRTGTLAVPDLPDTSSLLLLGASALALCAWRLR
jgi:hypothetical protein